MSRGKDIVAATAKATTWGTAVSVNSANAGLLLTQIAGLQGIPEPLLDESLGFTYPEYIDPGNVVLQPTLSGWLRWANTHWNLLCQAIGDDSISGGGPYIHTMDIAPSPTLFSTLAVNDGIIIREIKSLKIRGFSLLGEAGAPWRFELRGIGDGVLTSGQTNSSLGSVTARTKSKRIPFAGAQVRLNDQGDSSLGTGDKVKPAYISIVFDRDQNPEHVAKGSTEGTDEWLTEQPEEGGFLNCEVQLRFNQYLAATYLNDCKAGDFKKMDITFSGPAISGGNYGLVLSFPALRVLNVEHAIDSPARIVETITMRALAAQSAPSGMTGITNVLRAILTDDVSTAYDT